MALISRFIDAQLRFYMHALFCAMAAPSEKARGLSSAFMLRFAYRKFRLCHFSTFLIITAHVTVRIPCFYGWRAVRYQMARSMASRELPQSAFSPLLR